MDEKIPPSSVYFRDNDTLFATNPLSINIQSPFFAVAVATAVAAAAAAVVRSCVSFFSLFYTLFRFSLFCGLRRFALQLIISPLSYPLSRRQLPLAFSHLSVHPFAHSPRSAPLVRSFTIIIRGHIRPLCPGPDIQHNPP